MKHLIITLLIFLSWLPAISQNFDDLTFGTDATLEILTWNIEHFPKNGQTTVSNVADIIKALDADLIALQEISDTTAFKQMLQDLDEYTAYFKSGWYAGLAYIYKHDVIEINDIYQIYTTSQYWSPFPRAPMIIDFNFMGQNYIAINNHYKCCGDGEFDQGDSNDEETRRYIATNLLKEYIDNHFPNKRVFVLGDLNDIITDAPSDNIFQNIINDSENYLFADHDIAVGPSSEWSYPSWPSHLDHIIITNELFEELDSESSVVETIKLEDYFSGGWNAYDYNVSDHRPVAFKFIPAVSSSANWLIDFESQFYNYPNPFSRETTFVFNPFTGNAQIEVFNFNGQKVFSKSVPDGQTMLKCDVKGLPNGVYIARLLSNKMEIDKTKLIIAR